MEPSAYVQMSQVERVHWWYVARRDIIRQTIKSLNLPNNAKILEVGCGTGGNLSMLSEFGQVSAIEMDKNAIKIANDESAKNKVDIQIGSMPNDNPFSEEQFDLIVLFDVLEHIELDQETLHALYACLKSGGNIVISVPAYQWLWGQHDVQLHHKRRYLKGEVIAKLGNAGFNIQNATYFNTLLFPLAAAIRFWEKLTKNTDVVGQKTPSNLINAVLTAVFRFERHLLKFINLPFGISILAIGKKEKDGN